MCRYVIAPFPAGAAADFWGRPEDAPKPPPPVEEPRRPARATPARRPGQGRGDPGRPEPGAADPRRGARADHPRRAARSCPERGRHDHGPGAAGGGEASPPPTGPAPAGAGAPGGLPQPGRRAGTPRSSQGTRARAAQGPGPGAAARARPPQAAAAAAQPEGRASRGGHGAPHTAFVSSPREKQPGRVGALCPRDPARTGPFAPPLQGGTFRVWVAVWVPHVAFFRIQVR